MLTHLLDTSVYCQPLRKQPLIIVEKRWQRLGDNGLCVSVICEAEVLQGLQLKGSTNLWDAYNLILRDRLRIIDIDRSVAKIYAELSVQMTKKWRKRSVFDLLIAATAKAHSLTHCRHL